MRTITINKEINVYEFEELSEKVQEKVLDSFRDIHTDFDYWWDGAYEYWEETVLNEQFDDPKMYFSGFWSQGDGAMFEYSSVNSKLKDEAIDKVMSNESELLRTIYKDNIILCGGGRQSGRNYHEKSVQHKWMLSLELGLNSYDNIVERFESYSDRLEEFIIERYEDLAKKLYEMLESEYYALREDDVIKEHIIENNIEFLEDGTEYIQE